MDPRNQKQQQLCSSSSSNKKRAILDDDDDIDAYFLGLLPLECYASSPKCPKIQDTDPKGKKPLIIISDSDSDNDHYQMNQTTQNNLNRLNSETESDDVDDDDDDGDDGGNDHVTQMKIWNAYHQKQMMERERKYRKDAAKRYASEIHSFSEDQLEQEIDNSLPTTLYSEKIKDIKERVLKSQKKGFFDESLIWVSKRKEEDLLVKGRFCVPSLLEMSLNILAKNADAITSLDGVSDELKHRLSKLLCDSRKMNGRFLELLFSGFLTEIRLTDCSWLTEEEFTKYFGTLVTSVLEVVQLDKCGRFMTDYTLLATLAKSPNCLNKLISLSLTGACRLCDKGLQSLVSSATALRSLNLSQCSLLTSASLSILADSLGSILKELYLDDCILMDAERFLPALKRLEQLEVLSLARLATVSDKFIKNYIIARGHNIKELVLRDCVNLTDASMEVIAEHCSGLHALDLMNLENLTDKTIAYLTNNCQALHSLKLCRNPFSDEAIAAFLEIAGKSLEELSLNNIKKVGQQTTLSLANHTQNLHTLDLSWCRNLKDNELGLIVDNCLSLRILKLFGCSQVTNVFLKGHSNSEIQIIGLTLCPLLQCIEGANPHLGTLRYSSISH